MARLRDWFHEHGLMIGLQAAIVALGVLLRWPSMSYALTEAHAFRQTFTTIMIREYMTSGHFQLSPLPVFGPPWQLPTEFPLFQWLAALGGSAIGTTPQIAGRLTALVFFILTSLLATYLATRWFSRAAGIITLVLFQFLPFAYQWGNAPLPEFLATSAALLALVCLVKWLDHPSAWWVIGCTAAFIIAFLVKSLTAVAWVPVFVVVGISWTRTGFWSLNRRRWILGIPVIAGLLSGLAWTRFADSYKLSHPYQGWLATSNLTDWYYGTIDQRLDSATWQMIFHYSDAIYGSLLVFCILLVIALFVWPRRAILLALAAALPVGALLFTNVYYMHTYYQAAVLPALIIVMAAGIAGLSRIAVGLPAKAAIALVATVSVLGTAWLSDEALPISQREAGGVYEFPLAAEIAANVPEGAGVIIVGCDWDSTYLYLSGRRGLMVRDDMLGEPVPAEWLGGDLSYVAKCRPDIDLTALWPQGVQLVQVSESISRIAP